MRRADAALVLGYLVLALLVLASPPAHSQTDPLRILDGLWTSVESPRSSVIFNRVSADRREARLPFGQVSVSVSSAHNDSYLKVSGEGFDCYYQVAEDATRLKMTWDLRNGPALCPRTAAFERPTPPVDGNDLAVAECDRLAASPYDPDRPAGVSGVAPAQVDAALAVPACQAATAARPDDRRPIYQLARALSRVGGVADVEAARLYGLAADQGSALARHNLGAFYASGRGGLPKDDGEAARLIRLAADQGFAMARYVLGTFYASGRGGLPKDDLEAARLYRLAADQGEASAQAGLAYYHETGGGGVPKDEHEAARLYRRAADQGDAFAQARLASYHETGRGGVPKDEHEAARLYWLAAGQGNAGAQERLGVFYANGRGGLSNDDREATRLYKLAADQGNASAQANLGFFYSTGRGGLPKDVREAARLYKLAADQGHAAARANLGLLYETGRGDLPKDEREAAHLYKLAAEQGNAFAQARLGSFHANGRGDLPKDDREAARLYRLAADQGDAFAQANLGFFFETGRGGLPKDEREATRLYELAAKQGNTYAQERLAPKFETEPFVGSELLNGKRIAEVECAGLPGAVWVVVGGKGDCIRYYHTSTGGGVDLLIYLGIDLVSVNGRGEVKPHNYYLRETAANLQRASAGWSRTLALPYVQLARPGTEGSSGEHSQRRTPREIELISAAIDAIKARHGYERVHIAAYGEGAHAAAVLLAKRNDLGCVVLASGLLSLRSELSERGRTIDVTGQKTAIDPSTLVDRIAKRPDLRIFLLTDPDDLIISARSQTSYAKRLADAGLPARQIFAAAPDPYAHALLRPALEMAASCAKGAADDAIVAAYQTKLPATPPDAADPPLHAPDVITRGVNLTEAQCKALAMAVWVRAQGRPFCVRYWMSTAGGRKDEALVFFHGDLGANGTYGKLNEAATKVTAGKLQRESHAWSRVFGGPYADVGRVGAFGSSGVHIRDKRTLTEARVASAALDALKERHGLQRFHLVGQSGGGHTVAVLTQLRDDIGCAVMASASVSVKSAARERGIASLRNVYDPIEHVAQMRHRDGRRMIVVTDPDDRVVSARSQREFVERVRSRGLPILQITAAAGDPDYHGLSSVGRRLAADCAKGVADDELVKRYQDKMAPVAGRR